MTDTLRDRVLDVVTMRVGDLAVPPHPLFSTPSEQWFDRADAVLQAYGKHKVLRAYRSEANAGALTLLDNDISLLTLAPDSQWRVAITDLTDAEAAVIRPAEYELWRELEIDIDALGAQLRQADTDQPDIMALLSDLAEHAGVVGQLDQPANGGDEFDTTPALEGPTRSQAGQLWLIDGGRHRLLVGDCTDPAMVARLVDDGSAECVFTSPPYAVGIDYGETYDDTIENLRAMLPKLSASWQRVVMPGGFAVVNFGDIVPGRAIAGADAPCEYPMSLEYWPVFRADGWLLWSRRVWCKPNARVDSPWCIGSNRAAADWEHVWSWRKPGEPIVTRIDGDIRSALGWVDTTSMHGVDIGKDTHGAGMALSIVEWMLTIHSRKHGIVYEPFCGTGTTLIAAHRTGRRCFALEISPRFADVILQRAEAEGLSVELEHTNE